MDNGLALGFMEIQIKMTPKIFPEQADIFLGEICLDYSCQSKNSCEN